MDDPVQFQSSTSPQNVSQQGNAENHNDDLLVQLHHRGKVITMNLKLTSTLRDLSSIVASELAIPEAHQKFLISPRPGLLKPPFPETIIQNIIYDPRVKVTLLGSTAQEISELNSSIAYSSRSVQPRDWSKAPVKPAIPARAIPSLQTIHDSTSYTFLELRPLPYLPNPERSLRFLERLREDPGIRATMTHHKWSVCLLTEMNPADHTTQDSRTLGLNRNAGEVIELRLRTDLYDGYRDYKTIRKTLCHELTHNVHGEHDRKFWDLCKQVEREVDTADWRGNGHTVGDHEIYTGPEEGFVADHGAWSGGEYVLGNATSGLNIPIEAQTGAPLSRREILARAAEQRQQDAQK